MCHSNGDLLIYLFLLRPFPGSFCSNHHPEQERREVHDQRAVDEDKDTFNGFQLIIELTKVIII
jgi:hypothetical protein